MALVKAEPIQPPAPVTRIRLPANDDAAFARSRTSGGRWRKLSQAHAAEFCEPHPVVVMSCFWLTLFPLCCRDSIRAPKPTVGNPQASLYRGAMRIFSMLGKWVGRGAGFR